MTTTTAVARQEVKPKPEIKPQEAEAGAPKVEEKKALEPAAVAESASLQEAKGIKGAAEIAGPEKASDEPAAPGADTTKEQLDALYATDKANQLEPYRVPGRGDVGITDGEAASLDNPETRTKTAIDIGERVAREEALAGAFGGEPNLEVARKTYQALDAKGRAAIAGTAEDQAPDKLDDAAFTERGGGKAAVVDRAAEAAKLDIPPFKSGFDEGSIGQRASDVARALIDQSNTGRITPAQRAAMTSDVVTRGAGVLRAGFGAGEAVAGGGMMAAPTVVTQVAGALVAAHGVDNFQAGVRQAWTGKATQGLTEQGIQKGLEAAGVNKETAETIAALTDAGLSIGGTTVAALRLQAKAAEKARILDPNSPVQQALQKGGSNAVDDVAAVGEKVRTARISGGEASMTELKSAVDAWAKKLTGDPNAVGQVLGSKQNGELYGFMHQGKFFGLRSSPKETAGYVDKAGAKVSPHASLEVRAPGPGTESLNPWKWLTHENRHVNLK